MSGVARGQVFFFSARCRIGGFVIAAAALCYSFRYFACFPRDNCRVNEIVFLNIEGVEVDWMLGREGSRNEARSSVDMWVFLFFRVFFRQTIAA